MIKKIRESNDMLPVEDFGRVGYEPDSSITQQFFRPADNDEFPIRQYMMSKSGRLPTHTVRLSLSHNDNKCLSPNDVLEFAREFAFKRIFTSQYFSDLEMTKLLSRSVYEMQTDSGMFILTVSGEPLEVDKKKREAHKVFTCISGNGDEALFNKMKTFLLARFKTFNIKSNNVNLVIASHGGYDTQEFDLPKQKIDISLNYGKGFINIHKKIISELNKDKHKGLVLLHGTPGTGKTHYLKFLASKINNKKVLFIPPHLADFITSPEMTPFLIENSNSVLFIEDAERVITDREEGGSTGVSNILNLTDGILSDILNIQIVATFNMDKKKIDPALLRKGRLIAEHKFDALSVEDSNNLLQHLKIDAKTDKPLTLTQIYNYKESEFVTKQDEPRRIGFGS